MGWPRGTSHGWQGEGLSWGVDESDTVSQAARCRLNKRVTLPDGESSPNAVCLCRSDAPMAPPAASVQEAEAAPLSAEALRLMDPFDGLVTEIFRLDSRGWWRRRIVFMVRQARARIAQHCPYLPHSHKPLSQWHCESSQVLSAMAGDAMDKFIVAQIEAMQREHLIARAIKHLEESLWPKGVWFQRDATSRQVKPGDRSGRLSHGHCWAPVIETG